MTVRSMRFVVLVATVKCLKGKRRYILDTNTVLNLTLIPRFLGFVVTEEQNRLQCLLLAHLHGVIIPFEATLQMIRLAAMPIKHTNTLKHTLVPLY